MKMNWKTIKLLLLTVIVLGAIIFCGCEKEEFDLTAVSKSQDMKIANMDSLYKDFSVCENQIKSLKEYADSLGKDFNNGQIISRLNEIDILLYDERSKTNSGQTFDTNTIQQVIVEIQSIREALGIDTLYVYGNDTEEKAKQLMQDTSAFELLRLQQLFDKEKTMLSNLDGNEALIKFLSDIDDSEKCNLDVFSKTAEITVEGQKYTAYVIVGGVILARDEQGNVIQIQRTPELDAILNKAGVMKFNLEPTIDFKQGIERYTIGAGAVTVINQDFKDIFITKSIQNQIIKINGNANTLNINGNGIVIINGSINTVNVHSGTAIFNKAPKNINVGPGAICNATKGTVLPSPQKIDKTPIEVKKHSGGGDGGVTLEGNIVTEPSGCPAGAECTGNGGCDYSNDPRYSQFHDLSDED